MDEGKPDEALISLATSWHSNHATPVILRQIEAYAVTAELALDRAWAKSQAGRDNGRYRRNRASASALIDVAEKVFRAWVSEFGPSSYDAPLPARQVVRFLLDKKYVIDSEKLLKLRL